MRRVVVHIVCRRRAISIHAPRKGCDSREGVKAGEKGLFQSTHPARGATHNRTTTHPNRGFQSTHPARGATKNRESKTARKIHFNPRTPQGVRRKRFRPFSCCQIISIHAPRKGCDNTPGHLRAAAPGFQSTHPARGATDALRVEEDKEGYFNPRTPQGVRLGNPRSAFHFYHNFNPRTPQGVRPRPDTFAPPHRDFNPRTPQGVRPRPTVGTVLVIQFQSTHPARGATTNRGGRYNRI